MILLVLVLSESETSTEASAVAFNPKLSRTAFLTSHHLSLGKESKYHRVRTSRQTVDLSPPTTWSESM